MLLHESNPGRVTRATRGRYVLKVLAVPGIVLVDRNGVLGGPGTIVLQCDR